ncbi:MAG TPA: PQQ-binding-like beta-propeller repeat protein [Gemmatimonadaceae bacterium]
MPIRDQDPHFFETISLLARVVFALVAVGVAVSCNSSAGVDGKPAKLRLVWHAVTQASEVSFFQGTPAVSDGVLYLEDGNTVLALDAKTGATKWVRPVRVHPAAPVRNLVVRAGRVFVSETDSILAMDVRDGHTMWNVHPDAQALVYASADDRALYTGQRDIPFVYALDVGDGHIIWKVNIGLGWTYPGHVEGTAVSGDTVYVAARKWLAQNGYIGQGVLVALDRTDGHELWRYETPGTNGGLQDAPVVAGNLIVVSDLIGNAFFAYDRFAKRLVWRVQGKDNGPLTPPVVVGDDVYVGSANTHLYAVNLQTGKVKWDVTPGGFIEGTAFCAGQVFINAYQIQRRSAAQGAFTGVYNYDPNIGPFTSNIATDGTNIYFAGEGGVYALACE